MSTDPLGAALGAGNPNPPAAPGEPGQPGAGRPVVPPAGAPPEAPGAGAATPGTASPGTGAGQPQGEPSYQAPPAYEPPPAASAWDGPVEPERPLLERRPEILVGVALAGGFLAARVLGRVRGR